MRNRTYRSENRRAIAGFVLSIVFLSVWIAPAFGGKNAQLAVTPGSGKPRTVVSIGGAGFEAGETVDVVVLAGPGLRLGLGTRKVDAIVADDSGAFSVKSAIPRVLKPGKYTIEATGDKGSRAKFLLVVTK
ncbi:MAG: hypothetical protein ACE5JS_06240 [Nitrospinota bacterium]